ncbi:hypothetical protein cyc_07639 [Cyclospora cayetanensis]|uniref:SPT2 chromatin n=1 Tax=Cyclospora cayetanensis TaxID=88456 RepID=A0A1D3CXU3_9EIME|nr:hypothetical protein cyc_07639 [Cyclospora cayetanensis]
MSASSRAAGSAALRAKTLQEASKTDADIDIVKGEKQQQEQLLQTQPHAKESVVSFQPSRVLQPRQQRGVAYSAQPLQQASLPSQKLPSQKLPSQKGLTLPPSARLSVSLPKGALSKQLLRQRQQVQQRLGIARLPPRQGRAEGEASGENSCCCSEEGEWGEEDDPADSDMDSFIDDDELEGEDAAGERGDGKTLQETDWRAEIRAVTRYDPSAYAHLDWEECVESSFQQQAEEERRSRMLADEEDRRELMLLQQQKKRRLCSAS